MAANVSCDLSSDKRQRERAFMAYSVASLPDYIHAEHTVVVVTNIKRLKGKNSTKNSLKSITLHGFEFKNPLPLLFCRFVK